MVTKEYNYPAIIILSFFALGFIASLFLINWTSLSIDSWFFLIVSILLSNFAVTAGWHRYFAHRQFKTNKLIEFLFLWFGSSIFTGSAIEWVSEHNSHHAHPEDLEKDPTSKKRGFFYSHVGWVCYIRNFKLTKSLFKNNLLKWHHNNWFLFSLFSGIIVPFTLYYTMINNSISEAILIGIFTRIFISQHSLFLLGSWAHFFGEKDPTNKISARNSLLVSFLCLGDGYHLNHHQCPSDYRAGYKWYHIDFIKWIVFLGSLFGLFWDLRRTRNE